MIRTLLAALLLLASSAWAGPIDDAAAAYVRGDYAAALRITRPLAAKGEAWAQSNLGFMYSQGQGVKRNDAEAVKWFRLAAAQGGALGQSNLGLVYANGQGVVQDYAEAVKWYRLAAAQGLAKAQSSLGAMYGKGQGVPMDDVRAHMWFNLAAVRGVVGAVKNRDIIAKLMTPQQMAEAQKLARECQARDFKGC
jgi:TPR repeat protein